VEDFVKELRSMNVTLHVAAKITGSAIDGRTTRDEGYAAACGPKRRKSPPALTLQRLPWTRRPKILL
jgi:hypothetical protein